MNYADRTQSSVQPGEIFPGGPSRHLSLPGPGYGELPSVTVASTSPACRPHVAHAPTSPPHPHRVHSAPTPGSYVGYSRAPSMAYGSAYVSTPAAPIGGPYGYGPLRPEMQALKAPAPVGGPFGYGTSQAAQTHRQPMIRSGSIPSRPPSALVSPALAPLLTQSGHRAALGRPSAQYGQCQAGLSYGRDPSLLPPPPSPPPPPPPPPRALGPSIHSPLSPPSRTMLQTSQASTLSAPLTAADDDELARAMQLSKQSYEADELLRRHIDESVAPGPDIDPSTDEDEELARALEESLRSGPAPEIEPLPLYEPIASSAPAAPSPSFLQTASSQLPEERSSWGFLTSGPSSAFVQRSTSDDTLSVSVLPPPRTSSAAATILPSSTQAVKDYASARAPGLLSASPLPSPSTTSAGQSHQDIGVPQVSSPQPAHNESWGRTATSSSQDPLPEEAPTQPFALGTDDPHSSASDGGLSQCCRHYSTAEKKADA